MREEVRSGGGTGGDASVEAVQGTNGGVRGGSAHERRGGKGQSRNERRRARRVRIRN